MIEFVVASNSETILKENLLRSEWINKYTVHIQRGFTNISEAYNCVKVNSPIVVYAHQDVYFPPEFELDLLKAINHWPAHWFVLGVAGVRLEDGVKVNYGNINDRGKLWQYNLDKLPTEVEALDELLLITRGNLTFDENLPQDWYGADICLQARSQGRKCYVINAYCEHNSTRPFGGRTESFYKSQEYFRNKWKDYLPIVTTTALLT